jgi:hypothetical protein
MMKWPDKAPVVRRIAVPAPAAGANWSRRSDQGGLWLVRGLTFVFTTSAVVATRSVGIQLVEGDDTRFVTASATGQVTTLIRRYTAYSASPPGADSTSAILIGWPADGLIMPVGTVLSSVTTNIDAGDTYTAIVLDVVEYPATFPEFLMPLTTTYDNVWDTD